jgi:hypothetical protein
MWQLDLFKSMKGQMARDDGLVFEVNQNREGEI